MTYPEYSPLQAPQDRSTLMNHMGKCRDKKTDVSIGHDDVIKWKHFPRDWPFVWEIHRSPANSPDKGQRCGALMCSLICAWINGWVNNRKAGDLRRHHAHYDVTVMVKISSGNSLEIIVSDVTALFLYSILFHIEAERKWLPFCRGYSFV